MGFIERKAYKGLKCVYISNVNEKMKKIKSLVGLSIKSSKD